MGITSFARLTAPVALMLSLASCGQLGSPVAVLDLNRAVKESGLLAQVNNQLTATRRQLQQQLGQIRNNLVSQVTKAKEGLGEKPTAEQQAEFQKLVQEANQRYDRASKQANDNLSTRRSRLIAWMRQQVRPVARQVADAKGMKIVLLKGNAAVFDHDTSLDITGLVLEEMRKNGVPKLPQPQARPAQTKPAQTQSSQPQAQAPAAPAKPAAAK